MPLRTRTPSLCTMAKKKTTRASRLVKDSRSSKKKVREPPVETTSPDEALKDVLELPTAEQLSEQYDLLKLIGAVAAQIALLQAVTQDKDQRSKVSAARALRSLDEDPGLIAERLKSGPFRDMTTADLRDTVERIANGTDPKTALKLVKDAKKSA